MKTLDPGIRRILLTRGHKERLNLDIARGRVRVQSLLTTSGTEMVAHMRVLVELAEDRIPDAFRQHRWRRVTSRIYAADLPLDAIERLARAPEVVYMEGGRKLRPTLDASRSEIKADIVQAPPGGSPGLDGSGVIVGIVEVSGLDFTLDDFRDAHGNTRIDFLWDQSVEKLRPGEAPPAAAPFDFGVEYDKNAIDAALKASDPLAALQHNVKEASHATHVTGIAASNGRSAPAGRYVGIAPAATIIFVRLGSVPERYRIPTDPTDPSDTNDAWSDLLLAVSYIFEKAKDKPCVINISLGTNRGSHDGQTVVERTIDDMLLEPGRVVVKSAGNLHEERGHASGRLTGDRPLRRLTWQVRGRDVTANQMEIWHSSRDRLRIRLTSPAGSSTPWVLPDDKFVSPTGSDPSIIIHSERFTAYNGDTRIYLEIDPLDRFPRGNWIVEIEAIEIHDGRFDAWIESDESPSQFLGSDFDSQMTLSIPGTGHRTITVANYDHLVTPPEVRPSSGRGPTRDGRMKPEVAAPGTDIWSSCALGGRSGAPMHVSKTGTSMAAPHVAGAVALILQRYPRLTAERIRAALIASADREPGSNDFSNDFGFGRVNIARCLELLGQ